LASRVTEMLDIVLRVFEDTGGINMEIAASLGKRINDLRTELKARHVRRLSGGDCTVVAGLLYVDIISSFDRVGELCLEIIKDRLNAK
jgi:phosphate:Na+ symporter